MKSKYTPIITEEAGWWIGRIEEIPSINCRAKTRGELITLLVSALTEAIGRSVSILELFEDLGKDEKLLKASEAWRRGEGRWSN